MKSSFVKKIAILLIMFMVGTWSVSAAEPEDESPEGTVLMWAGIIGAVGLVAWLCVALFRGDEYAQVPANGSGIVPTGTEASPLETFRAKPQPETVFDRLMLGTDGESVYTGLRFQF